MVTKYHIPQPDRQADDHAHAKKLARGLAEIPGLSIDPDQVPTNILFFEVTRAGMTPQDFVQRIEAKGVRMLPTVARKVRAVTHYQISSEDIDQALKVISKVMG